MTQRWLTKLRPLFAISSPSTRILPFLSSPSKPPALLLYPSSYALYHNHPVPFPSNNSIFSSLPRTPFPPKLNLGFQSTTPLSLFQLNQIRHASKSKEKRLKRMTPAVSKLKKYKIKPYSSFKQRFRTLKDGQIRRWHAGKRHNAHLKSKISKRRLRLPALVHPAYAKVMKKLNFYG